VASLLASKTVKVPFYGSERPRNHVEPLLTKVLVIKRELGMRSLIEKILSRQEIGEAQPQPNSTSRAHL
jgi:hypothetical protein